MQATQPAQATRGYRTRTIIAVVLGIVIVAALVQGGWNTIHKPQAQGIVITPIRSVPTSSPLGWASGDTAYLSGGDSYVYMADSTMTHLEYTAAQAANNVERLTTISAAGRIFAAPRGTEIQVIETSGTVVHVKVIGASEAKGRDGWLSEKLLTTKH